MDNNSLAKLFQLEQEIRQADTKKGLEFLIVNRLRSLINFDQAVLFTHNRESVNVAMVSDVANIENNAPFVRWLIDVAKNEIHHKRQEQLHLIQKEALPESSQSDWIEWGHPQILWLPLKKNDDEQPATLWISRAKAFTQDELALLDRVAGVAAHALWALSHTTKKRLPLFNRKKWLYSVALLTLVLCFFPVEQTVLAPAHVVAENPVVIAAPMNGVVAKVNVEPNSQVKSGDVLISYEDTELHGRFLIAQEQVLLSETELLSARQAAFNDTKVKATIAVLESRLALSKVELDYVRKQVNKVRVVSPEDGVAIFNDKTDLVGLPVKTGQRLMQIANPYQTRLQIDLPIADGLSFPAGAKVRLFLDKSPLKSINGELASSSFEPYITPAGVLSYRLIARFNTETLPRLGLHGTAKLSGEKVSLFYYLFRRPLTAIRQMIGF